MLIQNPGLIIGDNLSGYFGLADDNRVDKTADIVQGFFQQNVIVADHRDSQGRQLPFVLEVDFRDGGVVSILNPAFYAV